MFGQFAMPLPNEYRNLVALNILGIEPVSSF
jgi:hypothetical protein